MASISNSALEPFYQEFLLNNAEMALVCFLADRGKELGGFFF